MWIVKLVIHVWPNFLNVLKKANYFCHLKGNVYLVKAPSSCNANVRLLQAHPEHRIILTRRLDIVPQMTLLYTAIDINLLAPDFVFNFSTPVYKM